MEEAWCSSSRFGAGGSGGGGAAPPVGAGGGGGSGAAPPGLELAAEVVVQLLQVLVLAAEGGGSGAAPPGFGAGGGGGGGAAPPGLELAAEEAVVQPLRLWSWRRRRWWCSPSGFGAGGGRWWCSPSWFWAGGGGGGGVLAFQTPIICCSLTTEPRKSKDVKGYVQRRLRQLSKMSMLSRILRTLME